MFTPVTPAEQLFFVTARLQCTGPAGRWSGTGFFVQVPVADDVSQVVIVTNRHVLDGAQLVEIIGPAADAQAPDRPLLGQRASAVAAPPDFTVHPDPDIDVAVMATQRLYSTAAKPQPMFVKNLPIEMIDNEPKLLDLDAIEEITFIGYPNAIHDRVNMTPIARRGWTATPIALDHNGKPMFLIDASVFPGSSGSPVFIVSVGPYGDRRGNLILGSPRVIFLGVVAAVHLHEVTGKLVPTVALPAVSMKQPMNLGIVYKSRTILDTIDSFLANKGLKRSEDTAPVAAVAVDPPAPVGLTNAASGPA